jgi:Aerobic-type carbon monoxide dehydrogenase, small subunit CoxS/CutS homologs
MFDHVRNRKLSNHNSNPLMAVFNLTINNEDFKVDVDPQMPLLWVIRDFAGLTGTKYGCGIAQCGACTVHLDGNPVRSCSIPVSSVNGQKVVTIEGLSDKGDHPLQLAWEEMDVPQCGYCQAGQIMTAAALLKEKPQPTDQDIDNLMSGNICRCGTYNRIKKAIHLAAKGGKS